MRANRIAAGLIARGSAALLPLATGLLLSGCDHERGPVGPVRSETREVGSFDAIDVEGNTHLQIAVGEPESVVIQGRELFVKRIRTEVHGDTLHIKSSRRDWGWTNGDSRVTLRISVPHLESLDLQGGNEVRITGFKGGDTRIEIQGAADIRAAGRIDELSVSMSGAGNADLSKLIATVARVRVSGVGSVYVHPKDTLDATMNGVGAIFYSGSPRKVNTHMNGLGTISQRDVKDGDDDWREDRKDAPEDASPHSVDPESLQPEYDDKPARTPPDPSKVESTGVI